MAKGDECLSLCQSAEGWVIAQILPAISKTQKLHPKTTMSDNHATATLTRPPKSLDYSLTGENSTKAIERGLAEADWYQSPVPRAEMRKLLEPRDGPAIRDTI